MTRLQLSPVSWLRQHWQKLLALVLWGLLFLSYVGYSTLYQISPLQLLLQLIQLIQNHVLGPLIYQGLYLFRPLMFFSAGLLSIASGYLFGPFWGVLHALFASNLSGALTYLIGRSVGKTFLQDAETIQSQRTQVQRVAQHYTNRLHANSFETVLVMRLVLVPFDVVNYLCGFLKVDFKSFVMGTLVGSTPATIAFVLFGASVENVEQLLVQGKFPVFDWRVLLASFVIFALSFVLSRYFKQQEGARG